MIASIVLIRMKRYIRIFRSVNATTVSTAIIPQQYDISNGLIFQKLVRKGIVVTADGQRYYMDEEKEASLLGGCPHPTFLNFYYCLVLK